MGYSLEVLLDIPENIAIYTSQTQFAGGVTLFKASLRNIETIIARQSQSTTWAKTEKDRLKEVMVTLAINIEMRTYAYGITSEKTEILDKLRISRTDFLRKRDEDVCGLVDQIIEIAGRYLSSLSTYGVTQLMLDDLEDAKTEYIKYIGQPKQTIGDKATATNDLKIEFQTLRKTVAVLDNLVNIFEATNPSFVAQYFITRRIYDEPTNTMALRMHVQDSVNHLPIANVFIDIPSAGINRTTSENGVAEVQNLAEGIHDLNLSHPQYQPLTYQVTIVNGQMTDVTIEMVLV